jgi:hypothetical protein
MLKKDIQLSKRETQNIAPLHPNYFENITF